MGPVDILEWREIEIFVTEQLAQVASQQQTPKPFYLFPRGQDPDSLVRILGDPNTRRVYRSYPMTFVSDRPEVQKTADQIGNQLKELAIVFDPGDLGDWDRQDELHERYEQWCADRGYVSGDADWEDIQRHLRHQTVSRDHRLIDQAHAVVVYYPELDYWTAEESDYKRSPLVPFSSGVLDEMQYATQQGKDVYIIWTSEKDPGPFLASIYSETFSSVEALFDYLNKK